MTTLPFLPSRRASSSPAIEPPFLLSVATRLTKSLGASPLSGESKITTGIFLPIADATGSCNAVASSGARTMPLTLLEVNCSTWPICWPRSSSFKGPCHLMSTPSSCPACLAPASTVRQKTWVVPLGMTAMVFFPPPPPDEAGAEEEEPAEEEDDEPLSLLSQEIESSEAARRQQTVSARRFIAVNPFP